MSFENFPYSNFHELNLDWIVQKLKEAYSSENPPNYPVKSVNGMTGDVIIAIPSNFVQSVNGETGDVVLYRNPLTQFPATDETRWNLFRICDGTEKGIEFDADSAKRIAGTRRILIYDEDNPPDYPVTSVNGQTGDVQITAGVQSVNGKTGNVVTPFVNPNTDILTLDSNSPSILWGISRNVAGGNVALYITTGGTNPQAFIRYTPDGGQAINLPLLTNADIPESAGVVSVNGKAGAVTLYGTDILLSEASATSIRNAIQDINNETNSIKENIFIDVPGNNIAWRGGYYRPASGEYVEANNYITSQNYIDTELYRYARATNNIKIALFAWNNSKYVGIYSKDTSTFITQVASDYFRYYFYDSIDLNDIALKFPSYQLKIEARFFPSATPITSQDMENVILSKCRTDNQTDISELTQTVQTHTQQITALQSTDATHTQQISALQSTDATHTQQISALQNTDATHTQQITALQTAVDNIQSGAGIKEVKLSEVVTLPARYPATGTDTDIKTNMACVNAILSRPGVQRTNFTVEFFDGYLNISGTMQGLTDIILYLTEV